MKNVSPIVYDEYQFNGIKKFQDGIAIRKCVYYASDFLKTEDENLSEVEKSVQRTLEIFRTLNIPAEEHFYAVYRCRSDFIYKDWKLSELACVYMLVEGDPTDLRDVARQQTELIDQMLQHIHPYSMAGQS